MRKVWGILSRKSRPTSPTSPTSLRLSWSLAPLSLLLGKQVAQLSHRNSFENLHILSRVADDHRFREGLRVERAHLHMATSRHKLEENLAHGRKV